MLHHVRSTGWLILTLLQRLAMLCVLVTAIALTLACIAAALGLIPWLRMPLAFGDTVLEAGKWVQIGLALLFAGLAAFLPANGRIVALETSHRRFQIGMDDVAKAYAKSHAADRAGTFTLHSEFDSVRERLTYLRDHPDLGELEPALLEVAAQMSHVSRDLARTYADTNVQRARDMLAQRQDEIEQFTERLERAKAIATDLRHWIDRLDLEEAVAASQAQRLQDELRRILPEIFAPDAAREAPAPDTITALTKAAE